MKGYPDLPPPQRKAGDLVTRVHFCGFGPDGNEGKTERFIAVDLGDDEQSIGLVPDPEN